MKATFKKKQDGTWESVPDGLTKREHFAAMAMQGILSNGSMISTTSDFSIEWASSESVRAADALLEELSK